jgi:hypothetical protein
MLFDRDRPHFLTSVALVLCSHGKSRGRRGHHPKVGVAG